MPTKLRMLYVQDGLPHGGGYARGRLEAVYKKQLGKLLPRGSLPEASRLVSMFKELPEEVRGALFLFREPRGIPEARSRWKQLAKYWGVAAQRKKKVLEFTGGRTQANRSNRVPAPRVRLGTTPVASDPILGNLGRGGVPGVGTAAVPEPPRQRFFWQGTEPTEQRGIRWTTTQMPTFERNAFGNWQVAQQQVRPDQPGNPNERRGDTAVNPVQDEWGIDVVPERS